MTYLTFAHHTGNTRKMKLLPTKLTFDGFLLTQIAREEDLAIYRQFKPGKSEAFEVIRIQSHGAATIPNGDGTFREVEAGESYPKSHKWGTEGWTLRTEEEAFAKFNAVRSGSI